MLHERSNNVCVHRLLKQVPILNSVSTTMHKIRRKQKNQTGTTTQSKSMLSQVCLDTTGQTHTRWYLIFARASLFVQLRTVQRYSVRSSRSRDETHVSVYTSQFNTALTPIKPEGMFTAHIQLVYHNLKTSKATRVLITHFRASWLPLIGLFWSLNFLWRSFVRKFYTGSSATLCYLLYYVVIRKRFCSLAQDDQIFCYADFIHII